MNLIQILSLMISIIAFIISIYSILQRRELEKKQGFMLEEAKRRLKLLKNSNSISK